MVTLTLIETDSSSIIHCETMLIMSTESNPNASQVNPVVQEYSGLFSSDFPFSAKV